MKVVALLVAALFASSDATGSQLRGKATMGKEDGHCELCLEMTHQMQHGEVPSCYVAGNANSYAVVRVQRLRQLAQSTEPRCLREVLSFRAHWQRTARCFLLWRP